MLESINTSCSFTFFYPNLPRLYVFEQKFLKKCFQCLRWFCLLSDLLLMLIVCKRYSDFFRNKLAFRVFFSNFKVCLRRRFAWTFSFKLYLFSVLVDYSDNLSNIFTTLRTLYSDNIFAVRDNETWTQY